MKEKRRNEEARAGTSRGALLVQSLTSEQLAWLLDVVFGDPETIARHGERLKQADADMAEAVSRALDPNGGDGAADARRGTDSKRRTDSDQKILERWKALWSRWDEIVSEVGDEEGRYVSQDADWEPPYFDPSALASDLDEVAADMEGMLDAAFGLVQDVELFSEAIKEIGENISAYPEGMGTEEDCVLETHATRCALRWMWLAAQAETQPGRRFIETVRELEAKAQMTALDDAASVEFFASLPQSACRDVYERLQCDDFAEEHGKPYSTWHKINHLYEERFDPRRHLETCREHLDRNWRYGKPLVEDAMTRGDYRDADAWLERTFAAYLGGGRNKVWRPDGSLLLVERRYGWSDDADGMGDLLNCWADVLEKRGEKPVAAASRFQAAAYRAPENWKAVIGAFKKARSPEAGSVLDRLFIEWQTEMTRRSVSHERDDAFLACTWIHWLIAADLDAAAGRKTFVERVLGWLRELCTDGKAFERDWPLLARLTADLPGIDGLRQRCPAFCDVVLPKKGQASELEKARREGLQRMEAGECLEPALKVWRSMLHRIVPDPAVAYGSRYETHVAWMQALHEMNAEDGERLLAQWRETHKRRRNLWRDLASRGLPLQHPDAEAR
jgi:hypothetical protein